MASIYQLKGIPGFNSDHINNLNYLAKSGRKRPFNGNSSDVTLAESQGSKYSLEKLDKKSSHNRNSVI